MFSVGSLRCLKSLENTHPSVVTSQNANGRPTSLSPSLPTKITIISLSLSHSLFSSPPSLSHTTGDTLLHCLARCYNPTRETEHILDAMRALLRKRYLPPGYVNLVNLGDDLFRVISFITPCLSLPHSNLLFNFAVSFLSFLLSLHTSFFLSFYDISSLTPL